MKCYISVVCVLSALLAITLAAPATLEESALEPIHNQVKRQTSSSTNNSQQEILNRVIAFSNQKLQLLRRLCPQLFQVIDLVIQNVTSQVFRVVGGALLRSGGLGGGGGSSSGGSSGGGRVSVVLPTFPPDEDEDDEDDDEEGDVDIRTNANTTTSAIALSVDLTSTTINNEIDGSFGGVSSTVSINNNINDNNNGTTSSESPTTLRTTTSSESGSTTLSTTSTSSTSSNSEPFTSPSLVSGSNTVKRHIRRSRAAAEDDQETAASGGNGPDPAEDLSNVDTDDTDRNKRYLPFGGDGHASGGSGNFLFDLVRLVAGSGVSEEADEKDAGVGGVAEVDVQAKSGDGEGIPGPITRLLVIANRGIANLIQDLILRLAQTSERIVNFKARLVTALI